jgi:hypothetical protein
MNCQSCDMPMTKDPQGGGTNKDGSLSDEYCSLCYGNGAFYYKGDDVHDFQKMVVDEMTKNGWLRPVAWFFTRRIPKLKPWIK